MSYSYHVYWTSYNQNGKSEKRRKSTLFMHSDIKATNIHVVRVHQHANFEVRFEVKFRDFHLNMSHRDKYFI